MTAKPRNNIRRELKECADITAFLDRKMLALNEEIQNYREPEYMPDLDEESYEEKTIEEVFGVIIEEEQIRENGDGEDKKVN